MATTPVIDPYEAEFYLAHARRRLRSRTQRGKKKAARRVFAEYEPGLLSFAAALRESPRDTCAASLAAEVDRIIAEIHTRMGLEPLALEE